MKTNLNHKQIIFFVMILILVACNPEKKDWEKTKDQNTIEAFKAYIEKYPESQFIKEATKKHDSLGWLDVVKSLDSLKLSNYIVNHPQSIYLPNAKNALDSVLWMPKQNLIDLVLVFWFNAIRPQKNEGFTVFGSLMVNTTGKAEGIVQLDSMYYSETLINRLSDYKNVSCKIVLKNVVSSYHGEFTKIESGSLFDVTIKGQLNHSLSIVEGEITLKDKKFQIKSGTRIKIDGNLFEFGENKWFNSD